MAKYFFFVKNKLSRKAGFGKNRPFLRPMSTFWPKKDILSQYSQYRAKIPYFKLVLAENDHFFRPGTVVQGQRMCFLRSKRTFFGVKSQYLIPIKSATLSKLFSRT
jgi:hypothetical protein